MAKKTFEIEKISSISEANATVGVVFPGTDKVYEYGIRVKNAEVLEMVESFLHTSGLGKQNSKNVEIVSFFPCVTSKVRRTLDSMSSINFHYPPLEDMGYAGDMEVREVKKNPKTTSKTLKMEKDDEMMKTTNNVFKDAGKQISGVFGMSMLNSEPVIQIGGKFLSFDKRTKTITEAMEELVIKLDFMPGILMPVLVSQLRPGDVVSIEGGLALVKNLTQTGATVRIIDSSGTENDFTPIVNGMFGVAYVLKLMNPMEGMMGQGQQAGFNPMMLMAMGSGDSGDMDMGKAMMMSMMMGGMQQQPPVASAGVHQSPWTMPMQQPSWMMPMPMPQPGETPSGWKVDQNKGDL